MVLVLRLSLLTELNLMNAPVGRIQFMEIKTVDNNLHQKKIFGQNFIAVQRYIDQAILVILKLNTA